jgi:hypothetical protein
MGTLIGQNALFPLLLQVSSMLHLASAFKRPRPQISFRIQEIENEHNMHVNIIVREAMLLPKVLPQATPIRQQRKT